MKLTQYLSKKRVAVLSSKSKEDALIQTLELFRDNPGIADHDALADGIMEREQVLPTGIGLGIGVPHVRSKSVRNPVAALTVFPEGIEYEAIDGQPVKVVLMVAMPEGAHKDYLEYLAKASRLFQDESFRNALAACVDPEELWDVLDDK